MYCIDVQDLGQRIAVLRGVEDALREVSSIGSNALSEQQDCPPESNPPASGSNLPQTGSNPPPSASDPPPSGSNPTRNGSNPPATSPPKTPPTAAPVPVMAKQGAKAYSYAKLKDCTSLSKAVKYNTWAVVISVSKQPGPTKGKKLMGQVSNSINTL